MPAAHGKKKRGVGRVSVTVHLPMETYNAVQTALDTTDESQSAFIATAAARRAAQINAKVERNAA